MYNNVTEERAKLKPANKPTPTPPGAAARAGRRDAVLRASGGAGGPAPHHARVVGPRAGRGPLGCGGGGLWGGREGGERQWGNGPGGGGPGEGEGDQEEHAGPRAPQRRWLLPWAGGRRGQHLNCRFVFYSAFIQSFNCISLYLCQIKSTLDSLCLFVFKV